MYSEFRALWRALLQATKASAEEMDQDRSSARRSRVHEPWSQVSKLLTGTLGGLRRRANSKAPARTSVRDGCTCTQASCAFHRLYHVLKDFAFPGKHLLQHKDANALEKRRVELQAFLAQLQRFLRGFSRLFVDTAASTQRCKVLQLLTEFAGMNARPASLSSYTDALTTTSDWQGRERYYSYCAGSPVAGSSLAPTLYLDSSDSMDYAHLLHDDRSTLDNQTQELTTDAIQRDSIRSSQVPSCASLAYLPDLQIKSVNVETFAASLDAIKDTLLRGMGPQVQLAVEQNHLSIEEQWALALFRAAEQGLYADTVAILRRGTDANAAVWQGTTALHAASSAGHTTVVQCLLAHGADRGPLGMTPLMAAVNNDQLEITKLMFRGGADVNQCNIRNVSAVHLAVANRSMAMLLLLLDHGARVDVPNSVNRRTPLHIAAEAGDHEICGVLLRYGARMSQCGNNSSITEEVAAMMSRHGQYEGRGSRYEENQAAEEEEEEEEDGPYRSVGRLYCPVLDYIDDEDGDRATDHDNQRDEDVAMVQKEGTIYAVL